VLLVACSRAVPAPQPYPLLDGRCDEYPAVPHEQHVIARDVALFVFQDRDYVWLCVTLPPNELGALDLDIAAPGLAAPLDLHASAQLGEWPVGTAPPDDAASDRWGNQRGWTALTVPFHGMRDGAPAFAHPLARELQLAKQRFGRGAWQLRLHLWLAAGEVSAPFAVVAR